MAEILWFVVRSFKDSLPRKGGQRFLKSWTGFTENQKIRKYCVSSFKKVNSLPWRGNSHTVDTSGDLSLQLYCIEMSLLLFFSVGWSKATLSKWYITTTLWYWWRSEAFVYTIEPTMFNFSDLFNVYHNLFILHSRFYVFVVDCKQMLKFSSCSDSRFSWF